MMEFASLTREEQALHCFLFAKAQAVYTGTHLGNHTSMNVFKVALELCYSGVSASRFLYVDRDFCSDTKDEETKTKLYEYHKELKCPLRHKGTIQGASLTDSEFVFITYLFTELKNFLQKQGGLIGIRIHGFSTQDMCNNCFGHMGFAIKKMSEDLHIPVMAYISSLFAYNHISYTLNPGDVATSSSSSGAGGSSSSSGTQVFCIPFRRFDVSKNPFEIKTMASRQVMGMRVLEENDTFVVGIFGGYDPINKDKGTTQVRIQSYCGKSEVAQQIDENFLRILPVERVVIAEDLQGDAGCTMEPEMQILPGALTSEDLQRDAESIIIKPKEIVFLPQKKVEVSIHEKLTKSECMTGSDNFLNCIKLKCYCLGIENPLTYRDGLDPAFAETYERWQGHQPFVDLVNPPQPIPAPVVAAAAAAGAPEEDSSRVPRCLLDLTSALEAMVSVLTLSTPVVATVPALAPSDTATGGAKEGATMNDDNDGDDD